MKKWNFTAICMLLMVTALSSCTKEGKQGEPGAQGPAGPDAQQFAYTLYFNAGSTYQEYTGIIGSYETNDVVVTYVEDPNENGSVGLWVQTPIVNNNGVNIYAEVSEQGGIYMNTVIAGAGGSPWTTQHYFKFKSVLIKGSGLIKHPDVDLSNYEEVKQTFRL